MRSSARRAPPDATLQSPQPRADRLRRQRLLDRIGAATSKPATLIAAPAGFGKTILVAQWLAEPRRPLAAWVCLEPSDDDPQQLWAHVGDALQRVGITLHPATAAARASPAHLTMPLLTILDALAATTEPLVLVFDGFHLIQHPTCHEQVQYLIEHCPPQAHLVVVTRADPGLRLGRLRASGDLVEIRADELAFTHDEAALLLGRAGVHLTPASIDVLVRSTEGWPAGLGLASLFLSGSPDADERVRDFGGAHRFIVDYLTEEVVSRHPAQLRDFVTALSLFDRFSAALCDHVLDRTDSAAILRELERSNLFLTRLDQDDGWYRFHHLFAAVARSELEAERPETVRRLHQRAVAWFLADGDVDEAVRHALAAGDAVTASELVQRHWLDVVDAGRAADVMGWLDALGPATQAPEAEAPAARTTAAWMAALAGDEGALAQHLAALDGYADDGPLPDGSRSVESAVAMIHGLFGYGGPTQMLHSAQRATALEVDRRSPFYGLAQVALGHAAYVFGDLDRASRPLANARANERTPVLIRALGVAVESFIEHDRGNDERGAELAEAAVRALATHGLTAIPQASLAYVALGRAQAAAGRHDEALATLADGLAVRRAAPAHWPWGLIHHLTVHARVAAQAGELVLAQQLLDELDAEMARFADARAAMSVHVDVARHLLRAADAEASRGEPLTPREAEVLRLLQGALSVNEIAAALYLSPNTVKTHARAVYRKLGVHTRAEAVLAARQQRLGPASA